LNARAARAAALDLLSRRDHASGDLRRKLEQKGYDGAVVASLLDALEAERLLDDRRFAENFVELHAARGQGPLRVRAELARTGLPRELIGACLDDYAGWAEQIERARRKKFGPGAPGDYAAKQRQARFLSYRGFTSAQIRSALGFDIDYDADLDHET
jgi:regulatory protein